MTRKRKPRRRNPSGQLVAAWASKGGRYWLKLYRSGDGTYSYQTDNGGGWGHAAAKIKKIVRDQLSFMPSKMRRVKVARTRNFASGHRGIRQLRPGYPLSAGAVARRRNPARLTPTEVKVLRDVARAVAGSRLPTGRFGFLPSGAPEAKALKSLTRKKYFERSWSAVPGDRYMYRLTAKGRAAAME